jgi:preprotein translocase subunit SecD
MNRYPLWKNLLILAVGVLAFIYALPNLYPDDPALQISPPRAGVALNADHLKQVLDALAAAKISVKASETTKDFQLIRFFETSDQLKAKSIAETVLAGQAVVAPNLVQTTPAWLKSLGAKPMNLGLDLRGGVRFVLEVNLDEAIEHRYKSYVVDLKRMLRDERARYLKASIETKTDTNDLGLKFEFQTQGLRDQAKTLFEKQFSQEFALVEALEGNRFVLWMQFQPARLIAIRNEAIQQNLSTLRQRADEMGVAQSVIQRQGLDRIVVEMPGVQDTAMAKRVLGRTASLEFRLVDAKRTLADVPSNSRDIYRFREDREPPQVLLDEVIVAGDQVIGASAGFDENGRPEVNIELDAAGGKRMLSTTTEHVGQLMGVVFIETKAQANQITQEKYLINVASINSSFGSRFRITGLDSPAESSELALLLRSGALAAPMYFVEERILGPSLGQDNIDQGLKAIGLGFVLIVAFMLVQYGVLGFIASIALTYNLVLLFAVMSLIPGATLTLPGLAGIVLTVSVAVDANVLIYSRIREELVAGGSTQQAISYGFDRAFSAIFDANFTNLLVSVMLFFIGTGAVKGFAVTTSIGVITSMFASIYCSRAIINALYGQRDNAKLGYGFNLKENS